MFATIKNNKCLSFFTFVGICSATILMPSIFHQIGEETFPALIGGSCLAASVISIIIYLLYHRNRQSTPKPEKEKPLTIATSTSSVTHIEPVSTAPKKEKLHPSIFETIEEFPDMFQILETSQFKNIDVESNLTNSNPEGQALVIKNLLNNPKQWLARREMDFYLQYLSLIPDLPSISMPLMGISPKEDATNLIVNIDYFLKYIKAMGKPLEPKIWALPCIIGGNHWGALIVDQKKRTIEYYDSFVNYGNYTQIHARLNQFAIEMSDWDSSKMPYRFQPKIHTKLQQDGFQCGFWALYFIEKRVKYPDIDFNLIDSEKASFIIARFRKHAVNIMLKMYLLWNKTRIAENNDVEFPPKLKKYLQEVLIEDDGKLVQRSIRLYSKRLKDILNGELSYRQPRSV